MRYKENGFRFYENGDYKKALLNFSLALKENPKDKEAEVGVLLADLANDNELQAKILYEYYFLLKNNGRSDAEEIIINAIKGLDSNLEKIFFAFKNLVENSEEDGIKYSEFLELEKKEGFKRAFERIMIGESQIIITKKKDLIDFIKKLIKNGYFEIASYYIEFGLKDNPYDKDLQSLLEELTSVKK